MKDGAIPPHASLDASFAILDGVPRHLILRSLLDLRRATIAELAEHSGIGAATVARHVTVLEDLNVVSIDLPRGSRRGRAANISLDVERYNSALAVWVNEMSSQ